jgi:hypothetical protein
MVPVGTSARAISVPGGLDNLRLGTFKATNMGNKCVRIILPAHEWMDAHGWNQSHKDCVGTTAEGLYAFHSYFPQAFWWDDGNAPFTDRVCVNETCWVANVSNVTFHEPPEDLSTSWQDLRLQWQRRHFNVKKPKYDSPFDLMSVFGRSMYCDFQSAINFRGGCTMLDLSQDRCCDKAGLLYGCNIK